MIEAPQFVAPTAPPIPAWLKGKLPDPAYQIKFLKRNGDLHWESNPGPQTWTLLCPYHEILLGGARGGGKSQALIAWFAMGDNSLSEDDPARSSFLNDPSFRGLILRDQYASMAEFVDEAADFFRPFDCKVKDDPAVFTFKSGAKIYTNHLGTKEAYNKYRGWGLTKIGIEELTQIPEQGWYTKLLGSLRGKKQVRVYGKHQYAKLRTQILGTTNPDGPGACVPYGEVMTPSGWRDIKTMSVGDPVFTVRPDGEIAISHVEQVHKGPRSGPMCYVNMRGFHLACTPNHSVAKICGVRKGRNTRDGNNPKFSLVEFQDLPGQAQIIRSGWWRGVELGEFTAPKCETRERRLTQPKGLTANRFCALLGWFLSEGCVVDRDKAVNISQKKPVTREQLHALLTECGFTFSWGPSGALIYAPDWWMYFRQFGHAADKFIPEWVKGGTPENLTHLFNALMDGDGHWEAREVSGAYYTISKQLADDVCEIALKIGYQVYVSRRVRHHSDNITYQVNVKRNKVGGVEFQTGNHVYDVSTKVKKGPAVTVRHSNKPVYCIGVPGTHTFFIRQHGAVWLSGNSWVKRRFVEVPDGTGKLIPWNTPMRDTITLGTRIFIPAQLKDNKYLRDDKEYMGDLLSQDEVTQAQWIHGDWNAGSGVYFRDYRPDGPRGTEEADKYPQANHRIQSADLKPWWFRWGSGDWGYQHNAVFHKFCRNESDKRTHVYDELAVRQVGSFELGVMLAKWWMPELESLPDHQITIALSPDAFSKTDATRTKAEQMEDGIRQVLGPYGAILLRYNEDERAAMLRDPKTAALMFERRKAEMGGRMCIALQPANNNRVDGWDYLRDGLRFRPALADIEPDPDYLRHILETRGIDAYEKKATESRERAPEILPKILLWRVCSNADAFLKAAMHDEPPRAEDVRKFDAEDGQGGDDGGDSLRYGLMHYKAVETVIPKSYWVNERMSQIQQIVTGNFGAEITDVNRLMQIQRTQAALYDQKNQPRGGSMILPRHSSMRHRIQ